jgi:tRNA pseudouridine55 synthase
VEVTRLARDGLIVVDKPAGLTSHDVVARIRRLAGTRRVGHAGTLDPMATGVLVVGVERATRVLTYLVGGDKRYAACVRLGQATVTDDSEGDVISSSSAHALQPEAIRQAALAFVGTIDQVPSAVSAVKVNGVRSYARVRKGEQVTLAARRVTITGLDIGEIRPVTTAEDDEVLDLDLEVACSSGTYVRAIARDLGATLGVGGHLTALRRHAVGDFTLSEAATLEQLAQADDPVGVGIDDAVIRILRRRDVGEQEAKVLSHGGPLPAAGQPGPYGVFGPDGHVIAIVAERDGRAWAEVVLAPAS